jgi:hypothetical protein
VHEGPSESDQLFFPEDRVNQRYVHHMGDETSGTMGTILAC